MRIIVPRNTVPNDRHNGSFPTLEGTPIHAGSVCNVQTLTNPMNYAVKSWSVGRVYCSQIPDYSLTRGHANTRSCRGRSLRGKPKCVSLRLRSALSFPRGLQDRDHALPQLLVG